MTQTIKSMYWRLILGVMVLVTQVKASCDLKPGFHTAYDAYCTGTNCDTCEKCITPFTDCTAYCNWSGASCALSFTPKPSPPIV